MKTYTLNLLVILVLLTSCNNTKKENTESAKPETEVVKKELSIKDTRWKLTSLLGKEVRSKDAFIAFSKEDNKVYGNGSCNNFNGTYELKEGNRITLSKIATTMMACEDMSIETQFLGILEKIDNYSLQANKMTLNKAKMAPLAVFQAVE